MPARDPARWQREKRAALIAAGLCVMCCGKREWKCFRMCNRCRVKHCGQVKAWKRRKQG